MWKFLYSGLNTALELLLIVSFPGTVVSSYAPLFWLNNTNALSSFWSPIPVNWATIIDLNPDALDPSARRPHIPYTERNEMLKIYGDAEVTVSEDSDKIDPVTDGSATVGAFWAL